jgi:hypothetical protein
MRATLFLLSSIGLLNILPAQEAEPAPVRTFTPYRAALQPLPVDSPDTATAARATTEGRVDLVVDPRVEKAMADYTERKHNQQGYRVQIFLGERRAAEDIKRSFLLTYPDIPVYLSWLAPNFRLRVGDLRTRLEAERLLRDMKIAYPGSYIVRDEIEPPPIPLVKSN